MSHEDTDVNRAIADLSIMPTIISKMNFVKMMMIFVKMFL